MIIQFVELCVGLLERDDGQGHLHVPRCRHTPRSRKGQIVFFSLFNHTADFIKKVLSVYTHSITNIYLSLSAAGS